MDRIDLDTLRRAAYATEPDLGRVPLSPEVVLAIADELDAARPVIALARDVLDNYDLAVAIAAYDQAVGSK